MDLLLYYPHHLPHHLSITNLLLQSSTANTITFSFAATDDSNIITGYECSSYSSSSLQEEIAFVPCTSPTVTEIPLESSTIPTESGTGTDATYLFQVRATDTAGNVDPSPATFQWTNSATTGTTDTGIATPTQQDPLLQQQSATRPTTTTTVATRPTTTTTVATRPTTTTTAATRPTTTTTAATRPTTTTTAATRPTTTTTAATRPTTTTTATAWNYNSRTISRNRTVWADTPTT